MRHILRQLCLLRTHRLRVRLFWYSTMSKANDNTSKKLDSEQDEAEEVVESYVDVDNNGTSCFRICIYSGILVCLVCVVLVLGREYIVFLLLYVEETNPWVSFAIFCLLYTIVAFPMTWGYILLNIAAGYLYGAGLGIAVVLICALLGITVAHFTMKTCLRNFVMSRLTNPSMRATIKVVDSENGAKIVFLSRLTPIPFGLQNALYAMSNIGYFRYIVASAAGMLPSQGMHVYMGSTLRSMEEVLSSSSGTTPATYIIFAAQLVMIIVLFTYLIHRARLELSRLEPNADILDKKEDVVSAMEKGRNGWVRTNAHGSNENLRKK